MSNKNLNLPNILSGIRLLMVPVTVILIVNKLMLWALAAFLFACITDMVDGRIARKKNLITKLGIWLDPLADKAMAVSVLLSFTFCEFFPGRTIIPAWVTITLFSKELIMILGGIVIMKNGYTAPSNRYGKIAAFIMNTSIASAFLCEYLDPYYLYFIYVGLALSVSSMVQYAVLSRKKFLTKNNQEKGEERE